MAGTPAEREQGWWPLLSLLINSNIPKISESDREAGPDLKFTMFIETTTHLVYLPKFWLTIVSNTSSGGEKQRPEIRLHSQARVLQSSQEKPKTMVVYNFGGVNRVHHGLCGNGELPLLMTQFESRNYKVQYWNTSGLLSVNLRAVWAWLTILGPDSAVGKKGEKKSVSEDSRRPFPFPPSQSTTSLFFFSVSPRFFIFYPTTEPGPKLMIDLLLAVPAVLLSNNSQSQISFVLLMFQWCSSPPRNSRPFTLGSDRILP